MSKNVIWDDLIRECRIILSEGDSHIEGIDAIGEIINIILLKWIDTNRIDQLYKKYCIQFDKTKNKNKTEMQIAELYRNQAKVYEQFSDTSIILSTNLTINHKYDLARLIITAHHHFENTTISFDKTLIDAIKKHTDTIPETIVKEIVEEINPKKNEIGCDLYCEFGDFIIDAYQHSKNITGQVYNENSYKIAILNLICNNIFPKNLVNNTHFLCESNFSQLNAFDFIMGTYDKAITKPNNIKFLIQTQNPIILQIQMCLYKLKPNGRCGIILPQPILYNNGINKNAPSLESKLTESHEYQIRKLLVDNHNPYKIIAFSNNLFAIFFIKDQPTTQIEFITQETKFMVPVDKIKENLYCLCPNMYQKVQQIKSIRTVNLTQSKISSCHLNDVSHTRLNYRSILHQIYKIIGTREAIKKRTLLNIEFGKYTQKGYKYIEDLDMSIQGTDARQTLAEIMNQCKKNKIKLSLYIKLDTGNQIQIKI